MRNDELFIDNQLVDLDDNTKITLKYKSNLFTDISKIVSNNSYSIKLPNTIHNKQVIDLSHLPSYDSKFPWSSHRGRYFRNGVEIIKDSLAILLSVSKTFDISLNWGNCVAFNKIVQDAKQLNELPANDDDFIVWDSNLQISNYNSQSGTIISKIDLGLKDSEMAATYHPSVRVSNILDRIQSEYGVTFNFPQDRKEFIDTLLIPCLTKDGAEPNKEESASEANLTSTNYKGEITVSLSGYNANTLYFSQPFESKYSEIVCNHSGAMELFLNIRCNDKIDIYINGDFWKSPEYKTVAGSNPYSYENVLLSYDAMAGDKFSFKCSKGVNEFTYDWSYSHTHMIFKIVPKDIIMGMCLPVISNLPNIKQIDFIKAICAMCGLFANPSNTVKNQIDFLSIDDIYKNKSKAKDWTQKVIASTQENVPDEMTFTLSDFAQNNILDYKEDRSVIGSYKGNITVSNNTLGNTRDILKLPFAASDMSGSVARVPLYSYKDDETLEYSKVEPRILIEQNDNGKSKAVFTGLDFETLVTRFYDSYMAVVNNPKIIKEKIQISDIDLKDIDVTIPVYLAQYGRFYAIVNITSENSGICNCQLLQLDA